VRAAGLNRADLSRRAGHFERIATRPTLPVAGLEAAGEVVAIGPGVEGFAIGDRVMGMPSGAYAEQALLDSRLAMRHARVDELGAGGGDPGGHAHRA
jgi:NADPH:quinone reductase-like Zn-dependent oxidoreductase